MKQEDKSSVKHGPVTSANKSRQQTSAVLPKEAREYARQLQANPDQAGKFLQEAGILTKSGKLTAKYR